MPPGYEGVVLGQNPVGLWMLNETSGTAIDTGTAGVDGVYSASGITRAGTTVFGLTSPDFWGSSSQSLIIPDDPAWSSYAPASGSQSWVALMRADQLGLKHFWNKNNASSHEWTHEISHSGPKYKVNIYSGGTALIGRATWTGTDPILNKEYHYAVTYDHATNTTKLYLNGVLKVTDTNWSGSASGTSADMWIGNDEGNTARPWDGGLCGLGLFDRVLTQTEITEQHAAAVAGP